MPDYAFNTNLSPAAQQSSMGDMLNLARGVQAYQQAGQVNPLLIQQAQQGLQKGAMEIEQLKKTQPLAERQLKAATETAEAGTLGAVNQLTLANRQLVAYPFELIARTKEGGNLQLYETFANRLKTSNPENKELHTLVDNEVNELKKLKTPEEVQHHAILFSQILQPPERFAPKAEAVGGQVQVNVPGVGAAGPNIRYENPQGITPTPQVLEIAGVKYNVYPPTTAGGQPRVEAIGAAGAPNAAPSAPGEIMSNAKMPEARLIVEDMPIGKAGITQLTTQQQDRLSKGEKIIDESVAAGQNAEESKQSIRKIREVITKAAGSAPGQAIRKSGKWIAGDADYDILLKNIADQQLRNAQAMGVPTNMAREASDMASGSADITTEGLKSVIDRADASNTAATMYRQGLKNYVDKRGLTGTVHANKFREAWADNYDVRIFLAKNMMDSPEWARMSKAEKQLAQQKIMKNMTPKEIETLNKKADNLERLEVGGVR